MQVPAPDDYLPPLDHIPAEILCAQDYETQVARFLPAPALAYIAGGSGQDLSLAANRRAFEKWSVWPRILADMRQGHTRLQLAGQHLPHPVLLAPVAYQTLAHPQAELATARAAAATDSLQIVSTLSSCTLEEIARTGGGNKWFQLYLQSKRESSLDLLRRAEAAGYTAIVLTLDASVQSPSLRALRAGFRLPEHVRPVNVEHYPAAVPAAIDAGQSWLFQGLMQSAPLWDDLDWLLTQTSLPVWVKGVLHPDDALALRARGVTGLIVSNHGGRGLDGAPASLQALPVVRAALGDAYPLLFDGGIRSGTDIFKALALGANAVLTGRLQMYALSVAGALGVAHMLKLLREELELCMAMTACATLDKIQRSALIASEPGAA